MPLILNHLNHICLLFLLVLQFKFKVIYLLGKSRIRRRRVTLERFLHKLLGLFGLDVQLKGLLLEVFDNFLIHMHHLDVVDDKLQDLSCEGGKVSVYRHPVDMPVATGG